MTIINNNNNFRLEWITEPIIALSYLQPDQKLLPEGVEPTIYCPPGFIPSGNPDPSEAVGRKRHISKGNLWGPVVIFVKTQFFSFILKNS